jgi:hypothetical protein
MEAQAPLRPRVSRETRLLFATVIVSVVALWVLARIRFPEQAPSVNPVAPVLNQLAPTIRFGDLAAVVSDVQPRALAPLVPVHLWPTSVGEGTGTTSRRTIAALRVQENVALALLDPAEHSWRDQRLDGASVLSVDRATGLAALRVAPQATPNLIFWPPDRLTSPRYLLSTVTVRETLSLRPVFVSTLEPEDDAPWRTTVWVLPGDTELLPGMFAFSTNGAFMGLVVSHRGGTAILPAANLVSGVEALLQQRQGPPGWLGLGVQALTGPLAVATGLDRGVIVTWVDPEGPAGGSIQVADILESMDDLSSALTEEAFRARVARLLPGDTVTLYVRRGELAQPVRLTAVERRASTAIGLAMRRVRDGAEVLAVEPRSAAERAGIRIGDVVTFVAGVPSPSPAQVVRALTGAGTDPLLVGLRRGNAHLVVPIFKK